MQKTELGHLECRNKALQSPIKEDLEYTDLMTPRRAAEATSSQLGRATKERKHVQRD